MDNLKLNTTGLAFVAPMIGRHPEQLPTQGMFLSDQFARAGYPVLATSPALNPGVRLLDICQTLLRYRHQFAVVILDVYGERSFVIEDIASRLCRILRKPQVMVLHNGTFPNFITRHPQWVYQVLTRAAAIVTPSAFLARAVAPLGFKARVIPNVLDVGAYPFRLRKVVRPSLFWMRSFYSYYNPMLAIRVLAALKANYPEARLVMAGKDKGMQADVAQYAVERQVADSLILPGFLDLPMKLQYGSACDIFINTNLVDNMPVGVLEAGALGLPVVATRVGGIPDLLTDEETALLVPDDDAAAMASAVNRLLTDPKLASRLSHNGRQLAEQSAWPVVRRQWEALFAEMRQAGKDW